MNVVRHVVLWMSGREPFPERARRLIGVPVKRPDRLDPADGSKPERRNVHEIKSQWGQPTAVSQPSRNSAACFMTGVAAGIGKGHAVGARGLRLQKERPKVCVIDRMTRGAEHLAAIRGDRFRRVNG
jgi:hypothetical protein